MEIGQTPVVSWYIAIPRWGRTRIFTAQFGDILTVSIQPVRFKDWDFRKLGKKPLARPYHPGGDNENSIGRFWMAAVWPVGRFAKNIASFQTTVWKIVRNVNESLLLFPKELVLSSSHPMHGQSMQACRCQEMQHFFGPGPSKMQMDLTINNHFIKNFLKKEYFLKIIY